MASVGLLRNFQQSNLFVCTVPVGTCGSQRLCSPTAPPAFQRTPCHLLEIMTGSQTSKPGPSRRPQFWERGAFVYSSWMPRARLLCCISSDALFQSEAPGILPVFQLKCRHPGRSAGMALSNVAHSLYYSLAQHPVYITGSTSHK